MGRRLKVWVSLILCLVMLCSNGVFVFASETETVSDLTIQSEGKGSETEEVPEMHMRMWDRMFRSAVI